MPKKIEYTCRKDINKKKTQKDIYRETYMKKRYTQR